MRTLLKNGRVLNVFLDQIQETGILLEDERIIGVDQYADEEADCVINLMGKYVCPGFIDGHIHIESSMLQPAEFVRVCLPLGTTTVIADPHEIANVSGRNGIGYMLEASKTLPMNLYFVIPSCVPATPFDEAGAKLDAGDLLNFYHHPYVLGLGEMMNYPGVINGDKCVMDKIQTTRQAGMIINGHAPMLSGKALDKYIAAGITDDHECSDIEEAKERICKGQWVMIRQGTAARNLEALLGLFEEPFSRRCMLVTDDKHPADLLAGGHIDSIIRLAVKNGKSVLTAIRMATIQAAEYYHLPGVGAIAPGYEADLLILDDLESVHVHEVYFKGKKVAEDGNCIPFQKNKVPVDIWKTVRNSFFLDKLKTEDFLIAPKSNRCRVIRVIPNQLLTQEEIIEMDFISANGINLEQDILKLAVIERHMNTGHIGLGFIKGMGLKAGAIASSVSHDSHNLIVVGTNEEDMAKAANTVRKMAGGLAVVKHGEVLAQMALPIGGLMGLKDADEIALENETVRKAAETLGKTEGVEPFMNLAFVSLPVIPDIKMTTKGLIDVNKQELVSLFV